MKKYKEARKITLLLMLSKGIFSYYPFDLKFVYTDIPIYLSLHTTVF